MLAKYNENIFVGHLFYLKKVTYMPFVFMDALLNALSFMELSLGLIN